MIERKKIIRNIVILAILFFLLFIRSGLHLTPLSAHESSERSIHYGPSEVVHIEDFDKGKYILCKYDKWISCNTVNRKLFFFWRFGNQPVGFENDKTKAIDYTWGSTRGNHKLYGIINDKRIERIQVNLKSEKVFTETQFYDDLFLLTWKSDIDHYDDISSIKGYDFNNNVIYEEER